MQFICATVFDTEQLAKQLASTCPVGTVIYLYGDLGAGKSTFARAFIHALGYEGSVKSPTYTLLETYHLADDCDVLHMDLYRLADPEEVQYLAIDEYENKASVWLIEWPEKGLNFIPTADLHVTMSMLELGRRVDIQPQNAATIKWMTNLGLIQS